nr:gamma-glutamyltransferase [Clostridium acetireducens]
MNNMYKAISNPYPSTRNPVYAKNGMVCSTSALASQSGIDIMKKGGNAIDAAIAAAACLTVVEPTSNGIGGDAFAIVHYKNKLYGLNSSGPAPEGISGDMLIKKGYKKIPKRGFLPVTVPGIPAAWSSLSKKFGKLPLIDVLQPAIEYAEKGYPVSQTVAINWNKVYNVFVNQYKDEEYSHWFKTFTINGRSPNIGEIWSCKSMAETLISIGKTYGEDFYKGDLADKLHKFSIKYKGYIRKSDLEKYKPEWIKPVSINYKGYDIWEMPPNGQGLIALMALNILNDFQFNSKESIDTYHKQIEAIKIAFEDGLKYITDPKYMNISIEQLLSKSYAESKKKLITNKAYIPRKIIPSEGGTVYLATADKEGNMVSYIQSNYADFGSGLVVPETGICLQNRGNNFSLNSKHCNYLQPGKKTYHTIIPGFLTKNKKAIGPFGVMGAFMQPQGHVQVIMNSIDFGLNPQAALDAPRFNWEVDAKVNIENNFPIHIAKILNLMGHKINITLEPDIYGRGQIIWRDNNGVLCGGTESRADGNIAVW